MKEYLEETKELFAVWQFLRQKGFNSESLFMFHDPKFKEYGMLIHSHNKEFVISINKTETPGDSIQNNWQEFVEHLKVMTDEEIKLILKDSEFEKSNKKTRLELELIKNGFLSFGVSLIKNTSKFGPN